LLAGGSLFGFLGLLLAIPVAAVIGVMARFAIKQYLAGPLYNSGPSAVRLPVAPAPLPGTPERERIG
jgi:hypothetical protein